VSARCDLIGIGASAGGIPALLELLPLLPADLPASVLLVLHRHPTAASKLPDLFARRTRLPIREPEDGDALMPGVIYLAPRDQHMTVLDGHIRLDRSPKQHHARPAIDRLFHSLAAFRERVVAALLTGTMSDGVSGLIAIRSAGGRTIAQDPDEAIFPTLPLNAIRADDVQEILRLRAIAATFEQLARGAAAA
jgi:two-component system chemotaxis response regulator CheB